jgi:hypothetical protein
LNSWFGRIPAPEARFHSLLMVVRWIFGTGSRKVGVTSVAAFRWTRLSAEAAVLRHRFRGSDLGRLQQLP